MATFVVGTDDVDASAAICDYLQDRVAGDDAVYAVNSLRGGDRTDSSDVRDGEDALNVFVSRLGGVTDLETCQFVRGNDPATDLLEFAAETGADELVIGVRKRTPTAKVVFGSTAQKVLLRSNLPVRVVPLSEG